jgi:putative ABC transport system permease protein
MTTLLFHTPANDPSTFALVALVFMAVALIASHIPARRVTEVDPLLAYAQNRSSPDKFT